MVTIQIHLLMTGGAAATGAAHAAPTLLSPCHLQLLRKGSRGVLGADGRALPVIEPKILLGAQGHLQQVVNC